MGLQHQTLVCPAGEFPHYYLCQYRPMSSGYDELSRSLIQFKNMHTVHVRAWTECAIQELKAIIFRKDLIITRALGHTEKRAVNGSPLDYFCEKLGQALGFSYSSSLLQKIRATPKISGLRARDRADALSDIYIFHGRSVPSVLIVDDILTSGATLCAIGKAIRKTSPNTHITLFTFASTSSDTRLNDSIDLVGKTYQWKDGEWSTFAEDAPHYSELDILRNKILADGFV